MRFVRLVCSFVAVLALAGLAGCKQGKGERCQVTSDCEDGLICSMNHRCDDNPNDTPDSGPDITPDAGIDAATPPSVDAGVPDAAPVPDAAAPDAA